MVRRADRVTLRALALDDAGPAATCKACVTAVQDLRDHRPTPASTMLVHGARYAAGADRREVP